MNVDPEDLEVIVIPDRSVSSLCDKCGKPVDARNDAVMLELLITGDPRLLITQARHLLPETFPDGTSCPGSPSRAQYITLDHDPRYPWDPKYAVTVLEAYSNMQSRDYHLGPEG